MKKVFRIILILLIATLLTNVNALEKEVIVRTNVDLEGKKLQEKEFKFELSKLDGTVVSTAYNDKNGVVTFDPIIIKSEDLDSIYEKTDYYLYQIKQIDLKKVGMTYDNSTTYLSVKGKLVDNDIETEVNYLQYNDALRMKDSKPNSFHAKDEDLVGDVYGVFDSDTKIFTVFRDTPGKYTNFQVIDNKTYFTRLNEGNVISMRYFGEDGTYEPARQIKSQIKEIIFKDPVKPDSVEYWFYELPNLERVDIAKLDTSLSTSFNYFFYRCQKLSHVDLTTLDTSKARTMYYLFKETGIEEMDFTQMDLSNVPQYAYSEILLLTPNLRKMNLTNMHDMWESSRYNYIDCINYIRLGDTERNGLFSGTVLISSYSGSMDKFINPKTNEVHKGEYYSVAASYSGEPYTYSGEIIRPACNQNETLFHNRYINKEIINPKTDTIIIPILLIIGLGFFSLIINHSKKLKI